MNLHNKLFSFTLILLSISINSCTNDPDPSCNLIAVAQEFNVLENSASGTIIGAINAEGAEEKNFVIKSGNEENIFTLNSQTGLLEVSNQGVVDYELAKNYVSRLKYLLIGRAMH